MNLDIWNITGTSGFHFGEHGLGQEKSSSGFSSDSIFSALAARLAELYGPAELDAWITQFQKTPPFVLSSAFPRVGALRFFPMPQIRHICQTDETEAIPVKHLKRVRFVSETIFRQLLAGSQLSQIYSRVEKLHDNTILLTSEEYQQLPVQGKEKRFWTVERRPRVTIDRINSKTSLYFTGRTIFAPGCGLWFAVRWFQRSEQAEKLLNNLLTDLGDAGLGGERSNGFGYARIEKISNALELPDASKRAWINLSRYLPAKDEIGALQVAQASYTIEAVGGWVYSPGNKSERRRTVQLLSEGSVLGPVSRPAPGQIVDIQPTFEGNQPLGHPAWRNGMALAVGLSLNSSEGGS